MGAVVAVDSVHRIAETVVAVAVVNADYVAAGGTGFVEKMGSCAG